MTKRLLSLMLTALLVLAVFIPAGLAEETADANTYYVYTENGKPLNVRSEPNGEIIGSLPYGTKVEVKSFINVNWALISFQYDKEGAGMGEWPAYVNRRFVIKVEPEVLVKAIEDEKDQYTGDPLADINEEFKCAVAVEPFRISVRPARVTSWVNMRWLPTEASLVVASYKATEELLVLKELHHYLMVQDPDTGDVGYIHKKFAAR